MIPYRFLTPAEEEMTEAGNLARTFNYLLRPSLYLHSPQQIAKLRMIAVLRPAGAVELTFVSFTLRSAPTE